MKKVLKTMTKGLAVFLSILLIVEILPTQVMAEAYSAYSAEKQYISNLIENPAESDDKEKAEILYEVIEKRDENTKVYKRADGTYTALVSQTPLHFMSDGAWKEINNTLVSKNGVLTNADNPFNVTLPERITSDSQITLENDGSEISFAVNDISSSDSKITDKKADITEEFEAAVANTKSEVKYEDVAEDTDIEYVVLTNGIKENIIVSDASSVKNTYSFDFDIGDLSYRLNVNNSVEIIDADNNVKFTIPAPVMIDSKLAFSYDIGVSITDNKNGTITLVYSPSKEWTGASERSYPITIDPAIVCNDYETWVEDAFVYNDTTDATSANSTGYNEGLALVADHSETVNGITEIYSGEVYTKINTDLFSSFGNGVVFTNVQYVFSGAVRDGSVGIKEITSSCNLETVTYNTKPTLDNSVVDFYTGTSSAGNQVSNLEVVNFDITSLFNSWINGETNNGFAVAALDNSATAILMLNGELNFFGSHTYTTTLIADYVYAAGYDESYNYHSQELGKAGTAYINDFTRELFLKRDDIAISGNIMPVSVSFMYNSGIDEYFSYCESVDENYVVPQEVYGNNWISNYNRLIYLNMMSVDAGLLYANYLTENGNIISFAVEMQLDEDDNEVIVFVEEGNSSGYSMELLETPSNYSGSYCDYIQVTRPDGTAERFDENGRLISVTKTVVTDDTPSYQTITVNYVSDLSNDNNFLAIDYITDGVGRKYQFVYDSVSGLLASIQCYDSNNAVIKAANNTTAMSNTYTYSAQSNLTSVSFNGVNKFTYDYDTQSNNLTQVELGNQYKVVYTYNSGSNTIFQMKEYAKPSVNEAYAEGSTINIVQQSPYQIQFSNGDNYSIVEQFNADGTLFATIDNRGNYSSGSKVSTNILPNNSFENGLSSWTASGITSNDITTDTADSATHSLDITSSVSSNKEISQIVAVPDGDVYTFSAYIKSDEVDVDNKLTMKIEAVDELGHTFSPNTRTIAATATEYTRYSVQLPYTLDEFVAVKVIIGLDNATGNFNIDTLQLEAGSGTGKYDYLINGALELSGGSVFSWSTSGIYSSGTASIMGNNANYIELNNGASPSASKSISQTVAINGEKDDIITFGCWAKGSVANNGDNQTIVKMSQFEDAELNDKTDRIAGIKLEYNYLDEENEQQTEIIVKSINGYVQDWQFLSDSVILKGDCTTVTVSLLLENTTGNVQFSKAFLSKDKLYIDNVEEQEELTLEGGYHEANVFYSGNGEGDPIGEESYCVCGEHCAYGVGCPCTCISEEDCNCPECQKKFDIQYDSFGNLISIILRGVSISTLLSMFNSKTYSNNGNYLATNTNENNKTTTYLYDKANGYLQSEKDPNNKTTSYSYDVNGNLSQVSKEVVENYTYLWHPLQTVTSNYLYDVMDRPITISNSSTRFSIEYNGFGNVTKLSYKATGATSGPAELVSYYYGSGNSYNKLSSISYSNGSSTQYTYDNFGNINEINNTLSGNNSSTTHRYYYDSLGNKVAELDLFDSEPSRIIYYNHNSVEIYSANELNYFASYDDEGDLYEIINGEVYTTKQNESVTDETTGDVYYKTVVSNTGETLSMTKLDDAFGRTKQKAVYSVDPGSNNITDDFSVITTDFSYKTYTKDGEAMASSLIDTYDNRLYHGTSITDDNLVSNYSYYYTYDDNGNITAEYSVNANGSRTLRYKYYYDEANQLVRLDDNIKSKTYVYVYDMGCNRTRTKVYNYTNSTAATTFIFDPIENVVQEYSNGRLTKFDGNVINYDSVGNPTNYNGNTLTWIGKQLKEFRGPDGSYTEYEYDINGLRTQKRKYTSSNELEYAVDYVWSDGKIAYQSLNYPLTITINGNDVTQNLKIDSKFIYADGEQTPCAIMMNGQEFLLVRNLLGDVTALVLADSGETIAEFTYSPWGEVSYSINDEQYNTNLTFPSANYFSQYQELQAYRKLLQAIVTALCPVTYRGYNYDFTTGLYYLQARYYNPAWGRFINADDTSILLSTTGTLHGANLYAYCDNNPVNKVDYSGYMPKTITQIIIVCVAAYIICDMGYGYYFNDDLSDFYGTINSDGLYVGKFAYRIGFNKHKITTVVWGSYHDWLKVASRMIKTKSSQERIDKVTSEMGELSYEMNKNIPDDYEDSQLFVWLNDALALTMYSDELVNSLERVKYDAPYARLTDKYKGYEAIAVIYKPAVYDYLEMKVRVNSSYNVKPESYDNILSTKGYN